MQMKRDPYCRWAGRIGIIASSSPLTPEQTKSLKKLLKTLGGHKVNLIMHKGAPENIFELLDSPPLCFEYRCVLYGQRGPMASKKFRFREQDVEFNPNDYDENSLCVQHTTEAVIFVPNERIDDGEWGVMGRRAYALRRNEHHFVINQAGMVAEYKPKSAGINYYARETAK